MKEAKKMKRNFVARPIWAVEKGHWERIKEQVPPETITKEPKLPCSVEKLGTNIKQEGWDALAAKMFPKAYLELILRRRAACYIQERELNGETLNPLEYDTLYRISALEAALRDAIIVGVTLEEDRKQKRVN